MTNWQDHSRACHNRCPQFRVHLGEAERRGSPYATSCGASGDDPAGWQMLNKAFLEGPAGNCPAGRWDSAQPVSVSTEKGNAGPSMSDAQVRSFGPMLVLALQGDEGESVLGRLERVVEAGMLEPEAAAEIADMILKG